MQVETNAPRLSAAVGRLKPSATLAVSGRVKQLVAEGRDVIGFGAGEPDFDTPDPIKETAIRAIRDGMTGYQPVAGTPEAREAIATKLAGENGIACSPADIVVTVGAKHALFLAIQALVDPGERDEVVLLTPAWVSYRAMVELCGGSVVEVAGPVERDFLVTPAQLEAAITERTAAVILNSPSNPCGTMYTPDEIDALAAVIARHAHVTLISDEIYEKLVFTGVEPRSPGAIDAIADRVVTVNGLSKAYAMTGWRLGYVCAPGHGFAKAMAALQSQMTSHPTSFCLPSIPEALVRGAEAVERMRAVFAERAAIMHDLVAAMPDVVCPRPTGAFYVFPDVGAHFGKVSPGGRRLENGVQFAEALLEEALVGVVPGDDFGDCARTHVRLSFACSLDQIREGCRRIDDWLRRLTA